MPSAFSQRVAETTMMRMDRLIREMQRDSEVAPASMKKAILEAVKLVEKAKKIYTTQVLETE
jgi:hypothetical protein